MTRRNSGPKFTWVILIILFHSATKNYYYYLAILRKTQQYGFYSTLLAPPNLSTALNPPCVSGFNKNVQLFE